MEQLKPRIKDYDNYRAFLRDYYLYRKILQPNWGFIQWANEAGTRCPSLLNMVVKGRRHASRELTETLITYLKFNDDEANLFRQLVGVQRLGLSRMVPTLRVGTDASTAPGTPVDSALPPVQHQDEASEEPGEHRTSAGSCY